MTPTREGGKLHFTVQEAADVLGITRQSVYAAIRGNRLRANTQKYGTKIDAEELVKYGYQTGRNPQELLEKIREAGEMTWGEAAMIFLAALGVVWLLGKLMGE